MALIVEDGSGVIGANAYIDTSFADNYLVGDKLEKWNALSDGEKESAILSASQFIDLSFDWIGNRKTFEQGLSWPRVGAYFDGFPVLGLPIQVKQAAAETILLGIDSEWSLFAQGLNGDIASEQIGSISVSYFDKKIGAEVKATQFDILNRLLRGLYKAGGNSGVSGARVLRV